MAIRDRNEKPQQDVDSAGVSVGGRCRVRTCDPCRVKASERHDASSFSLWEAPQDRQKTPSLAGKLHRNYTGFTRRGFAISAVATLMGCGCGGGGGSEGTTPSPEATPPAPTARGITRGHGIPGLDSETALVVFNGEVLCISFVRDPFGFEATHIEVRRWSTGQLLASHPWNGGMGTAIVHNGEIHIFGNTNWQTTGNRIVHAVLGKDFAPTTVPDALQGGGLKLYNTDVCAVPGGFRMVVEAQGYVFFARSTDLVAWTVYGGQFAAGQYVGSPSLDYIGGVAYVTWLANVGTLAAPFYVTQVARSFDDCNTFQYGGTLIAPDATEENNASDVDFVEYAGQVVGLYLNGDQLGRAATRTFRYSGTLREMLEDAFS